MRVVFCFVLPIPAGWQTNALPFSFPGKSLLIFHYLE